MEIRLENITKLFGSIKALDKVNLTVKSGECLCLLGPSGCGKSTTLRIIAGLEMASEGHVYIGETNVDNLPPRNRNIALVFQNYALYPHMSVYDNLAFPLVAHKTPKEEINQRVTALAEMLRIDSLLKRSPGHLSGGQAQRVALGRAIIRRPSLFLMDEPLSNIDAKLRVEMRVELEELHEKLGITTIYVTHDQEEAMTLGERLAVMRYGALQQIGTPEEVYSRPINTFVAGFIGNPSINFLDGILMANEDGRWIVQTRSLDHPLEIGKAGGYIFNSQDIQRKVTLGIRPEHIKLTDKGFRAEDRIVESLGRELRVYIQAGDDTIVGVVDPFTSIKSGDRISFTFDNSKVHFFDQETGVRIGN